MNIQEFNHQEREKELKERQEEIKVKLERTENMFQNKEKKWGELERIVVNYARKDVQLRNKLSEIKYICDDPSSKRRITTVVEENEQLKSQMDGMKSEIEELKTQFDYAKSNPTCTDYDLDYFAIGDKFVEDEIPMEKKALEKRMKTNPNNISNLSDNKSNMSNLNHAFIDRSRIDTSNMLDDGSILGSLKMELNSKSQSSKKLPLKQNFNDSFGPERGGALQEDKFEPKEDQILSGCNIRKPNTFELQQEISELEKSIGSLGHNRTLSDIKYPSLHNKMESNIKLDAQILKDIDKLLKRK